MATLEIDGKTIEVEAGATVMDAANRLGIFVPQFCYHKKLSIAANCRMCLVQVEKASKPLPACATPVTDGMKVWTHSELAVKAQKGVMEFLLINHPLDCPICDQGGECQLQDLAVGYGGSSSRYAEPKRVVKEKDLGPLVSTDMTRCIHCTRCVRFGQEIAGIMELGMPYRGEYVEIMPFLGHTVDSELSGNIIDLCPVGALTSKPFRYIARNWEMSRRRSVSPHDGLGANLAVHVRNDRVMRVTPVDNEAVNECWLADRDRFSFEAVNSEARLTRPRIRDQGHWRDADWQEALDLVASRLKAVVARDGAGAVGALATGHQTFEELALLADLMRGLGSDNVDFRLRQRDFRLDGKIAGVPWLGLPVADMERLDRILVVGSTLRKDHPLLALRIRKAVKHGAELTLVNPVDDDLFTAVKARTIVAPSAMPAALAGVVAALAALRKETVPGIAVGAVVDAGARAIAASLAGGKNKAVFLGNLSQHHPDYAVLHGLAAEIARMSEAVLGVLGESANSVGAWLAGAVPGTKGLDARAMLDQPRKAYLLLGAEIDDFGNPRQARAALAAAEFVVALTPFADAAADIAQVMLPIAPFTETSGTYISTEGRVQSFHGAAAPLGESRPGWKVLRVLGNLLGLSGFQQNSSEAVRDAALAKVGDLGSRLSNAGEIGGLTSAGAQGALQRIGEVSIYHADALTRRAPALQATVDGRNLVASMRGELLARLGLSDGAAVRARQGDGEALLIARRDDRLPDNCVRVPAGWAQTAALGDLFGEISVERAD